MHSPGFSKPVHGYGQDLAEAVVPAPADAGPDDENWAGEGFEQPCDPE